MDTLTGTWHPLRAELDGELAPKEALEAMRLILGDDHYRVKFGREVSDQGVFSATQESSGWQLTLVGKKGVNAGRTLSAIAQLRGDRLRICFGLNGQRPSEFTGAPNSGCYLVNYRRDVNDQSESVAS